MLSAPSPGHTPGHAPNRLRVGVSGHRVPPKLPEQSETPLRALLPRLLAAVVDTAREGAHVSEFVVVSALAEGSDRIVAEAALAVGFKLEVVLPLHRSEYERDFETEESLSEFRQLLARASAIFELNGAADERPLAYAAAGRFMLEHIDLLIAIWDGEQASGVGGTAEIVNRAIADSIAVLWIESTNPRAVQIAQPGTTPKTADPWPQGVFRAADLAAVTRAVQKVLSLRSR